MVELRRDPLRNKWVIINTNRILDYDCDIVTHKIVDEKICPFCYGNEYMTPFPIVSHNKMGHPASDKKWDIRVIPNKNPILAIEGNLSKRPEGMFDVITGIGANEVIIETSKHNKQVYSFTNEELSNVIKVLQGRIRDLKNDMRFEYILPFKNYGQAAGEIISHSNIQLIALPIIPKAVKEEIENSKKYYETKERCLVCDIIAQELQNKVRVVCENNTFVAFTPFASVSPFEVWILPKGHIEDFRNINSGKVYELAQISIDIFKRLYKALKDPAYNMFMHILPLKYDNLSYYHWHIEIVPKISKTTGFEVGTGIAVNQVMPEEAAKFLRDIE